MDGDYERAKKSAFDDNLVLNGAPKSVNSGAPESKGTFNAKLVRKQKKEQAALPEDRRAYAEANESRMFKAMPPPLKCSAA